MYVCRTLTLLVGQCVCLPDIDFVGRSVCMSAGHVFVVPPIVPIKIRIHVTNVTHSSLVY